MDGHCRWPRLRPRPQPRRPRGIMAATESSRFARSAIGARRAIDDCEIARRTVAGAPSFAANGLTNSGRCTSSSAPGACSSGRAGTDMFSRWNIAAPDPACTYTRSYYFDEALGRYVPDAPLPACSDYLEP